MTEGVDRAGARGRWGWGERGWALGGGMRGGGGHAGHFWCVCTEGWQSIMGYRKSELLLS